MTDMTAEQALAEIKGGAWTRTRYYERVAELCTVLEKALSQRVPEGWHKGCPPKPYGSEWFIAKLDNGGKVVLRELPEESSYDYTTRDETYFKAFRIKEWMQFPDSEFIPHSPAQSADSDEFLDIPPSLRRQSNMEQHGQQVIDELRAEVDSLTMELATAVQNGEALRVDAEICADLVQLVEGFAGAMDHGTWVDCHGFRLKDTKEWANFYCLSKKLDAAIDAARGKDNEG